MSKLYKFQSYILNCELTMKHVKLTLENEHIEGILVKEDDKHLVLKLSSGYNIGIKKNKILKIEDIHSHEELVKEQYSEKIQKKIFI